MNYEEHPRNYEELRLCDGLDLAWVFFKKKKEEKYRIRNAESVAKLSALIFELKNEGEYRPLAHSLGQKKKRKREQLLN